MVLKRVTEIARAHHGESVIITYWPHPRLVLNKNPDFLKLINTIDEKETILDQLGIDHFIKIPFTREFAQLSSEEFIRNVLVDRIGTRKLVIGYNHRFGRNREGNFENLVANSSKYGFEVEEIPRQEADHMAISSTLIRKALHEGDVTTAARYLGRPFSLSGIVIQGDKLGHQLGFPTANLKIREDYKLIPGNGTYAVWVRMKEIKYRGMMNIGFRPTVNGQELRIEVNIIDFNDNIYGEELTVLFAERLRDEKKFGSLEALKEQLNRDRDQVIRTLPL
jgi:riboflavin kinase/FMN adenylyltransferase